jgi:hypothetical protein
VLARKLGQTSLRGTRALGETRVSCAEPLPRRKRSTQAVFFAKPVAASQLQKVTQKGVKFAPPQSQPAGTNAEE